MKSKPLSVRLSKEALNKCEEAMQSGYSRNEFIERAILGTPICNKVAYREILEHFCQIETITETMKNATTKERIREELQAVCRILRSPMGPI